MKSDYIDQLHRMCALLYDAHTNIDYFPTNFVVQNGEIYYIDYECNEVKGKLGDRQEKEMQLFEGSPKVECAVCADVPNLFTLDREECEFQ